MAIRSRRQKLLEGMCRTIYDRLQERVARAALERGAARPPVSTSAIFALALAVAPGLLEQVISVFRLVLCERGGGWGGGQLGAVAPVPSERERERMLSAVRASVGRARLRGRTA